MTKNILKHKNWNPKKIKKLMYENKSYKEGVKLFANFLISKGWSARKLEKLFDVSFKQITIWFHEFDERGEEALKDKQKTGRNSKLSTDQRNQLKKIILEKLPSEYNINNTKWTGENIIILVEKLFGVKYKKAQIYNILKSLSLKSKKGKWFIIS